MGLIKAGVGSVGGVMADQWKEFFYCEALPSDVLMRKVNKRIGSRSSNTQGSDNIITNGSLIVVSDGQCAIIVDQGKVAEICAVPGDYIYDQSTEPSLFTGKLGDSVKETFKQIGRRFTFGGDTAKDQRVYYINTKEIIGNKFGTPTPILFKVLIPEVSFTINTKVRCSGMYTYVISDPIRFYTKIAANVESEYKRESIDEQLKSEMIDALQPAFGELSAMRIDPSEIPAHSKDLKMALNKALAYDWTERRGISVESIAIVNLSIPEEDEKKIQDAQEAVFYSNPGTAAGMTARATATAMNTAAANESGAMNGFVGMGMAMNQGAANTAALFGVAQQQQQMQPPVQPVQPAQPTQPTQPAQPAGDAWQCTCGATATGKFCTNCGAKKPDQQGWTCACGAVNQGKFCPNCGAKKPEGAPLYKCDKCGWTPEDPHNPPKFCPECGDAFNELDIQ